MVSERRLLEVGDRVRVYGREWDPRNLKPAIFKAVIQQIKDRDSVIVLRAEETGNTNYTVHPKQVRRLVKKQRREWVISVNQDNVPQAARCDDRPLGVGKFYADNEVVRVREVRKP